MSNLGTLRNINPRVTWKHEDENFTPWLSENLTLLDNALNMNLELVEEQVEVGRYKCDLLCRDTKNGELVVIENQLDAFNHDHLGKALVYTAGLDAKTVIWIAEDFTNEHRKTIDWLNESTNDRFQFFGVQIEVIQIDNSPCAPKFNILIKPNDWVRPVLISNEYWQEFTDYLKQHGSELEVLRWQSDPDYLVFYLGYGENNAQHPKYWASVGRSNGYIAANFCLNKQHLTENLKWFSKNKKLVNQKFNEVFGAEPQRPDNPYVVVGVSQRSDDKSEWNSEFEWLRENIEKIERLFKPGGELDFLSGETS